MIGFEHPSKHLRQGADPWGQTRLGYGDDTFAKSGCAVVSLTMALRIMGVHAGADPRDVERRGMHDGAFPPLSSAAVLWHLAKCNDLQCPTERTRTGILPLTLETLKNRGCVWAWVDTDQNDRPNHWILIYQAVEGETFYASDPAYGKMITLAWDGEQLQGKVNAKPKDKVYRVKAIFPLTV